MASTALGKHDLMTSPAIHSPNLENKHVFSNPHTKVVSNLKRHQKSVHEQIKYGCRLCDLKLSSRGSLKKHIVAIHEGKTCICELCNSEFKSLSGLLYHRQSVHSEKTKVHKCDICNKFFQNRF